MRDELFKRPTIRLAILFGIMLWITNVLVAQDAKPLQPAEDWVYIQNEELRVGLLRSHGGAIAYLSSRESEVNTLNHYDHGRLIQQSYYGDEDGSRWGDKPWRYNPVQGGDYQGRAAQVVECTTTESTAYVKTTPRHWASGKLLNECSMEQWAELDGPLLRVRYKFTYQGNVSHQPHHQETPAVFIAPKLSTLITYTDDKPWTSESLTSKTPGWPNEYMTLSEHWAAYVGDDGRGVGVYVPGAQEATCYRYDEGAESACSYIAPLHTFALTPGLSFSFTAYFTLGNADTIRARFASLHKASKD